MKKVVIAILLIVSIFLMAGCGGNAFEYSKHVDMSAFFSRPDGEVLDYDCSKLHLMIWDIKCAKVLGNSFLPSHQARGTFALIHIVALNKRNDAVEFDFNRFKLVEMKSGKQYDQSSYGLSVLTATKKINPGLTAEAWIMFDVPDYLINSDTKLGVLLPGGFLEKNVVMSFGKKKFEKLPWDKIKW